MTEQTKPLAVVTGASSGIGLELARQFAQHGFDLVIAAENQEIENAAGELRTAGPESAQGEGGLVDVAAVARVPRLYAARGGRRVDAAALNAGIGLGGAFVDNDL